MASWFNAVSMINFKEYLLFMLYYVNFWNRKCYLYDNQEISFVFTLNWIITEFLPLEDTIPLQTFVVLNEKGLSHDTVKVNFEIFLWEGKEKKKKRWNKCA